MKSCRQIKLFYLQSSKSVVESYVNTFCETHEVIDIKICDDYIMVVYRDLKEVSE